jgi:hypothetical protein
MSAQPTTPIAPPAEPEAPAAASVEPITVDTEQCSTNLFFTWASGAKPEEIFNLQFTVRGNPTAAQIRAHMRSVKNACGAVLELGGHAQSGRQSGRGSQPAASAAPGYSIRTTERGKRYLELEPGQPEPAQITCEIHGKRMARKVNEYGVMWCHRDGEDWCRVAKPGEGK